MSRTAFYSGSFDPPTIGHLDIITRCAALVDRLVIGLGVHHQKKPFLEPEQRVALLDEMSRPVASEFGIEIEVVTFDNLAVDAAKTQGAQMIVRGLRNGSDFDYEVQMAGMNGTMTPDLETIFLAATPSVNFVAATFVRQIAAMGGDIRPFVTEAVADAIAAKYST